MKSKGVTNPQFGKLYFLKYLYHLGPFSGKMLYSRCDFVQQSRVIFSQIRLKGPWLNGTILKKARTCSVVGGVSFSGHGGGLRATEIGCIFSRSCPCWSRADERTEGQRDRGMSPLSLSLTLSERLNLPLPSRSLWAPFRPQGFWEI